MIGFSKRRRMRITYLCMAVVAFALSLVTGDPIAIASAAFILCASLLGAAIAARREAGEASRRTD